jgi:cellulose synthase/poly-beta-1,6-N-acetylglucosamine synthase-like glycosyltransferase
VGSAPTWAGVGNVVAAAALAALLYSYVGYPLLLSALAPLRRRRDPTPVADADLPAVTVVIPCYNEAGHVAAKIANLRAADYPPEKIEVVVVSDGSGDRTVDVARAAADVRVVSWLGRRGKAAALNAGLRAARGDVIVLTDANARVEAGALRALVTPFADRTVGAVCGEQVIGAGAAGERFYWRYEAFLKRREAALGSVVGADGSLYAVRRELFRPLPEDRLIMDDFFVSLAVVAAGRRLAYSPTAVAYEDALATSGAEFRRKARIMAGSLAALGALDRRLWLRLPWQLISHKILRWLGPAWLALAAVGAVVAAAAGHPLGYALAVAQVLVYGAAALAAALGPARAPSILRICKAFVVANAALAYGWGLYLFGPRRPAWRKLR